MKQAISIASLILILKFGIIVSPIIATDLAPGVIYKEGPVLGKMIDAGFLYGDANYHAIIQASDGNIYYVICSHNKESGAHFFKYDPRTEAVCLIADLTEVLGEDRTKVINQGKVHSDLYEWDNKLFFGTHAGAYDQTYPGGHFMSYDLLSGKFEDFGIGSPNQGLVALNVDRPRGRMYAISWPGYNFLYYDVISGKTEKWEQSFAPTSKQGPRSIGIDPRTGNVYWPGMNDTIFRYNYEKDAIKALSEPKFDAPMFHIPLIENVPCSWRSIRWSEAFQRFYGVMYYSDWLFSFEPKASEIEIITRIASGPNRKSGKTFYSSLAFELSNNGKTVYYIAHNNTKQTTSSKMETELHLVTYDIPFNRYIDHGVIEL